MSEGHVCPKCNEPKPNGQFGRRKRGQGWVDDTGQNRSPYCKACEKARVAEWTRRNREKVRQRQREWRRRNRDRINAKDRTPEGRAAHKRRHERRMARIHRNAKLLAEHREKMRLWQWEARRRQGVRETPKKGPRATDTEKDLRLPVEPFRLWLDAKAVEYGNRQRLAEAVGLVDRRVRAILDGDQAHVSIDTVDRALTREGSTLLFELYPDLYPEIDLGAVA